MPSVQPHPPCRKISMVSQSISTFAPCYHQYQRWEWLFEQGELPNADLTVPSLAHSPRLQTTVTLTQRIKLRTLTLSVLLNKNDALIPSCPAISPPLPHDDYSGAICRCWSGQQGRFDITTTCRRNRKTLATLPSLTCNSGSASAMAAEFELRSMSNTVMRPSHSKRGNRSDSNSCTCPPALLHDLANMLVQRASWLAPIDASLSIVLSSLRSSKTLRRYA